MLLAFAIPALCVGVRKINSNSIVDFILYAMEGASPTLAAIIVVMFQKKSLRRYIYEKYLLNLNLQKCVLGIIIPFSILTCAKMISILMGDGYFYPVFPSIRKIVIISWALVAEELGWRGYLQDKLERFLPNVYIPLLTGVIWCFWHYHFIISGSMEIAFVPFMLGCIFESYGYFVLTKLAKNNVVPACIWHFTGNLLFNIYRFDPQWHNGSAKFYWIATACYAINILLFVMYKKKNRKHVGV